ncbi:MAG TPA: RNA 2',3'-cyclic phosphodiesterase [Candidatus Elarobacter sp.]|nr:RNA 2',3'-cyclic phosphodiesterase [Candidatus Elarobacter sp.]
MRLFLAIDFARDLRDALHHTTTPLRAAAPDVRWVSAERLHLTVKFLGEQTAEIESLLHPIMDAVAARHHRMDIALAGVGAFPSFRRARVVWIGVTPSVQLARLYDDVDVACERLGVPRETRAFRPHVTLGRVRPGTAPSRLRALALAAESVRVQGTATAETLDLMESVTAGGEPRYVTLHRAPLERR